jgi:hypothetical protein
MEKLPFDIHFCIYNFLEFEKKYEMRFILEDYNQLFINDINKQNISIELINDYYGETIIKKYIYNEDYFYKNLYIDKITLDKINNFKTLKEQNNFIEKILINEIKTTNEVFMINICNRTDYILSISGKPNKYEEYKEYDGPVCLLSNVDTDCDY